MNGSGTGDRYGSISVDPLTGLHDRSRLDWMDREYPSGRPSSLLIPDVDHFKLINDIYGHLTADKVLKRTALTIQVNLKESDTALRFGGDEFIVFFPRTGEEGAMDLAQRLTSEMKRSHSPPGSK